MHPVHPIKQIAAPANLLRSMLIGSILCGIGACSDDAPTLNSPEQSSPSTQTTPPQNNPEIKPEPVLSATERFWQRMTSLCDQRFPGQLTIGTEESDREIGYAELFMHVERCKKDEIDIAFIVDDDDSRTWQLRNDDGKLALYHEHVDESGKPDQTSGYGGLAREAGSEKRQEFPADENTADMIPAAATNVWAIEIVPGKMFAYELQRVEEQRMFRVVFDLTEPLGDL